MIVTQIIFAATLYQKMQKLKRDTKEKNMERKQNKTTIKRVRKENKDCQRTSLLCKLQKTQKKNKIKNKSAPYPEASNSEQKEIL